MANLALSPTLLTPDSSFASITAAAVALTGFTGVTFSNPGSVILVWINGSTASNATTVVGATVLGQAVTNLGPTAIPVSASSIQGPFHSVLDAPGTSTVTITLSSVVGLSVALIQIPGVI